MVKILIYNLVIKRFIKLYQRIRILIRIRIVQVVKKNLVLQIKKVKQLYDSVVELHS